MDLKQYRAKIAEQAIKLNRQAGVRELAMNAGEYQTPRTATKPVNVAEVHRQLNELKKHYMDTVQQLNKIYPSGVLTHVDTTQKTDQVGGNFMGKSVRKMMKKAKPQMREESSDESSEEEDEPAVQGGKMHFVKSMKKLGKDFGQSMKKVGIQEVTKTLAQEGVKYAKNNIGSMISGAESVLPEALPIAEESAPLLLMAAGMNKPKRTRKVSEKERRRHDLVRKLMSKHGCSLAEASSHIKENNIQY